MTIFRLDRRLADLEDHARRRPLHDLSGLSDEQLDRAEAILTAANGDFGKMTEEDLRYIAALPTEVAKA